MSKERDKLAGFAQHGVILTRGTGENARAETCPICGSTTRSPFTVHVDKLLWSCVSCGASGDFPDFLGLMQAKYATQLAGAPMQTLETNRGIHHTTLRTWGIGWNPATQEYAIPYRADGKVTNLRLWRIGKKGYNTVGSKAGLFISPDITVEQAEVTWICEGEWDAMVLWAALRSQGIADAVIGLPGALSFPGYLAAALTDKDVKLAYDHDVSGVRGETKARQMLGQQPRSVASVLWPAEVKQGFDIRNLWEACKMDVAEFLSELYAKMDRPAVVQQQPLRLPAMPQALAGPVQAGVTISVGAPTQQDDDGAGGSVPLPPQPTGLGLDRDEVIRQYRKWLRLPSAEVLDVMFGMLFANRLDGAPLWLFLVGPPGCGKTELVMSTYGAPLISSASTMSVPALISGSPNSGTGDPSLIPKWNGRVVAFKDFTVILTKQPKERDEIFGILRGAFDGLVEKSFGSSVGLRRYRSQFGILSGVTAKIEEFGPGNSVVGERFLKYYMRQSGVLRSGEATIAKALDDCDLETEMHQDLRETARAALDRFVNRDKLPVISTGMKKMFVALAMWTARLRGAVNRDKYTNRLYHKPQSEIGTRLVKQLYRLATGIAIFKRKDEIGMEEYKTASKVARFSVPDLVEDVVRNLYVRKRGEWTTSAEIAQWTRLPPETLNQLLTDMGLLDIVVRETGALSYRWMLSRALVELMEPLGLYTRERVMAHG